VYEELYMLNKHFDLNDILQLIKSKPVINTLNNKYAGEYWYKNHADELKTISYQR